MLRSSTLLFAGTALSALLWVACSSDTSTNPDHDTGALSAELSVSKAVMRVESRVAGDESRVLRSEGRSRFWTSDDISSILVSLQSLRPADEGCILEGTVDGDSRQVRVSFDPNSDSFSITSQNTFGQVLWTESYQLLDRENAGIRVTEVGPAGFGLTWTREPLAGSRWRESFSAIGLPAADLSVEVDYDDPQSVADGTARFEDWLPPSVQADVFHTFEGFAIRSILRAVPDFSGSQGAGLAVLITDESAARSVVEKVCILAGLCTGIKCTFGGGVGNPVCVGCSGITIACSLCSLFDMGC